MEGGSLKYAEMKGETYFKNNLMNNQHWSNSKACGALLYCDWFMKIHLCRKTV